MIAGEAFADHPESMSPPSCVHTTTRSTTGAAKIFCSAAQVVGARATPQVEYKRTIDEICAIGSEAPSDAPVVPPAACRRICDVAGSRRVNRAAMCSSTPSHIALLLPGVPERRWLVPEARGR